MIRSDYKDGASRRIGSDRSGGVVLKKRVAPDHRNELRPPRDTSQKLTARDRATLASIDAGKLAPHVAITELVALVKARKLSADDAILRVDAASVGKLHLPQFAADPEQAPLAMGIGVSNGCASGIAVFDPARAALLAQAGKKVVLFVREIAPDEVSDLARVHGVICREGDYASHTSVLARDYGIPAINCNEMTIDRGAKMATIDGVTIREGDEVSLRVDGIDRGELFAGAREIVTHAESPSFRELLGWCRALKGVDVLANADLPGSVRRAIDFGAAGVGLVRTEHMFFGERRKTLQSVILALGEEAAREGLAELAKLQKQDFEGIFESAQGAPVAIRLMDPPLHEFLPQPSQAKVRLSLETLADRIGVPEEQLKQKLRENPVFDRWVKLDFDRLFFTAEQESDEMMELAKLMGLPPEFIHQFAEPLQEVNPMMGLRGVRLSAFKPEITEMQIRSMLEASASARAKGTPVDLEIMIPLVTRPEEVSYVRTMIERVKADVEAEAGLELPYRLSVMIETPAAAIRAAELAPLCEAFSFGTNDLTQFTLALSRGDAAPILESNRNAGITSEDPFHRIEPQSVGKLIAGAAAFAAKSGICGEQGADPSTIARARDWGVDYVSVSAHRVATALVASAQENIERNRASSTTLLDLLAGGKKK